MERFLADAMPAKSFELIRADILDASALAQAMKGCDIVFHLAANADVRFGTDHPSRDLEQNTIGTVTNTQGEPSYSLNRALGSSGIKLNVAAVFSLEQVRDVAAHLDPKTPAYVSVFAGRIADTGRDPMPLMAAARALVHVLPHAELIWGSPRELLNVFHAEAVNCDIITMTNDVLAKLSNVGKDLHQFSLETVQMFRDDAVKAGFKI